MDFKNYYIVAACLLGCSIVLNTYGIRLFCKRGGRMKTQGILLVNLSLTEITGAVLWLLRDTVLLISQNAAALHAFGILMICLINVRIIWYIAMFSILFDRFVACNFPLKHMILMEKSRTKKVLVVLWIIFLTSSVVFSILDIKYFKIVFTRELFMAFAGLFVVFFFITYASILHRLARGRPNGSRRRVENSQFIRVTSMILLTFVLFEIVPSVIGYINKGPLPSSDFLHATALLTDPIIYILFQRDLRAAVAKTFRLSLKKNDRANANINSATETRSSGTPCQNRDRVTTPTSPLTGKSALCQGPAKKRKNSSSLACESGIFEESTFNSLQDKHDSTTVEVEITNDASMDRHEQNCHRIRSAAPGLGRVNPVLEENEEEEMEKGKKGQNSSPTYQPEKILSANVKAEATLQKDTTGSAFTISPTDNYKPGSPSPRLLGILRTNSEESDSYTPNQESAIDPTTEAIHQKGNHKKVNKMLLRRLLFWKEHQEVELQPAEQIVNICEGKYHMNIFSSQESVDSIDFSSPCHKPRERADTQDTDITEGSVEPGMQI
ncbi:uncharacterized protein LOC135681764 [Rhopilema esculentum]|uniref:uncharacterized protein LOC135681764 n=1 Tax=Rhopilema esculentum TaxID=499914 RepID=UPI0031CEFE9C|eukprot:gene5222-366_t